MSAPADETELQDDERTLNLRGDIQIAVQRGLLAGADWATAVACLANVAGELLAEHDLEPNQLIMAITMISRQARDSFEAERRRKTST